MSINKTVLSLSLGLGLAFAASTFTIATAAPSDPPAEDKCAKYKKGSADWKKCAGQAKDDMSDQDLYYAGYWLARTGQYAQALDFLTQAKVQDERVLTYIGFATRKLGNVDGAMALYDRALALNPNYTPARAYLGEAFLGQGNIAKAKAQLSEIAARCGTTCADHVELQAEIAKAGVKG